MKDIETEFDGSRAHRAHPMRFQRRGGRKLIVTPEVSGSAGMEGGTQRNAGQGARARTSLAAADRDRPREIDHRPRRAGGRDGRLRSVGSCRSLASRRISSKRFSTGGSRRG